MTTEIAILNKSAAALAADSAVTIGRGPNAKIFNTVNKIFELSNVHPVGIMVYNRLDFMGLPYETLIKQFRKKLGDTSFPHVSGYRDAFINFLKQEVKYDSEDEIENALAVIYDALQLVSEELEELVLDDVRKRGKYLKSKVNGILQQVLRKKIKELRSRSMASGFNRLALPTEYDSVLEHGTDYVFGSYIINEATKVLIKRYVEYALSKDILSSFHTGIVIAGFGDGELCPSLEAFETDGIIDKKFKYVITHSIDIGRRGPDAEILGFAQDDMVQRFVHGLDPDLRTYMDKSTKALIEEAFRSILLVATNDKTKTNEAIVRMESVIEDMAKRRVEKTNKYVEDNFSTPLKQMIRSMPKQELSTLAASLVEITSLKRKVSREQESVGGEVDVAVISKSEGFIWIKRKHYFKPELNARFFVRHFGEPPSGRRV